MFELFRQRAEAVSAEVHRFSTRAGAQDFVVDLLRREGVGQGGETAVWAPGGFRDSVDRAALAPVARGVAFEVTRDGAAAARIGITQADWAIANTGTLAQDVAAAAQRLASTLPAIHVALVRDDRLLPDLGALLARLGPAQSPYVALVTGPSRTADIERVLTIGVHGPKRLVVVFFSAGEA